MATEQELAQALGPAFGIYPKAFRGNTGNPQDAANLPVDVMRGRTAGLLGLPSDLLNMFQSPKPMEVFGDVQYEPKIKVPYDTEHFLKTLPLAPTSRAGQVAGQAASFVPLNLAPLVRAGVAGAKALAPTAARMTEGYLQRQSLMPGVMPEQPSLLGNITTKPKAEVSPLGFYSAVEQQALNIPRKQGSGESFLNDLAKGQDVKKYEMETMGLDEFLRGKPNVTRQEVQDYIAGNRINVQEKQLGGAITEDPLGIAQRKAVFDKYEPQIQALYKDIDSFGTPREVSQRADNQLRALQEMRDAEANAIYTVPEPTPTKYEKYQLPGGENYREILLTTPVKGKAELDVAQIAAGDLRRQTADLMEQWKAASELNPGDPAVVGLYQKVSESRKLRDQAEATAQELKNQIGLKTYRSSHFDEPNILAHMRVNDRIDADGKKMLLIEEVQSDWHQAGREKGYLTKNTRTPELIENELLTVVQSRAKLLEEAAALPDSEMVKFKAINAEIKRLNEEAKRLDDEFYSVVEQDKGVPDAPFKDTWHQLALKRALKEAVDKGYDRIGLTTGKQQVDRFSDQLRQNVDQIDFSAGYPNQGTTTITATKNGQPTFEGNVVDGKFVDGAAKGKSIDEVLGKSIAQKILSHDQAQGMGTIKGNDLTIGGEGMKKYYDEIYPAFLNKQGKKYGAQVGETQVPTDRSTIDGMPSMYQNKETVRYLDITPEMRKAIQEGQPIASIQNELAKALA
jgi:hypothetical protein